jgi:hypothetical protein
MAQAIRGGAGHIGCIVHKIFFGETGMNHPGEYIHYRTPKIFSAERKIHDEARQFFPGMKQIRHGVRHRRAGAGQISSAVRHRRSKIRHIRHGNPGARRRRPRREGN